MTRAGSEVEVAIACDQLARDLGYTVENYSDARKVRTAPGLPDRRYVKRGTRLWVELKQPGPKGKLTEEQHAFLTSENASGGMATAIDDSAQLLWLFKMLARKSSISDAMARGRCEQLVAITAAKGWR